ncbi:MAG: hypothetical protein ABEI99_08070 [Halobaculum sp.]
MGGFHALTRPAEEPVVADRHYEAGNVVVENWDDSPHTIGVTVRPTESGGDPVFTETVRLGPRETTFFERVTEVSDRYRATARLSSGETDSYDRVFIEGGRNGQLDGRGVQVRVYRDGRLSVVAFTG